MAIKHFQTCKECGKRVEFTKKGLCFGCVDGEIKPKQVAQPVSEKELFNKCVLDLYKSEQKRIELVQLIEKINKQNRHLNKEVINLIGENERLKADAKFFADEQKYWEIVMENSGLIKENERYKEALKQMQKHAEETLIEITIYDLASEALYGDEND
jgi:hypothetical protein